MAHLQPSPQHGTPPHGPIFSPHPSVAPLHMAPSSALTPAWHPSTWPHLQLSLQHGTPSHGPISTPSPQPGTLPHPSISNPHLSPFHPSSFVSVLSSAPSYSHCPAYLHSQPIPALAKLILFLSPSLLLIPFLKPTPKSRSPYKTSWIKVARSKSTPIECV